jgi:hypothetical protein
VRINLRWNLESDPSGQGGVAQVHPFPFTGFKSGSGSAPINNGNNGQIWKVGDAHTKLQPDTWINRANLLSHAMTWISSIRATRETTSPNAKSPESQPRAHRWSHQTLRLDVGSVAARVAPRGLRKMGERRIHDLISILNLITAAMNDARAGN